ncbi:MAG: hypothetical protein R3D45_12975 [Rhizobiaceae bacterium]
MRTTAANYRRVCAGVLLLALSIVPGQTGYAAEDPGQPSSRVIGSQQALFSRLERLWAEHDARTGTASGAAEEERIAGLGPDAADGSGRAQPSSEISAAAERDDRAGATVGKALRVTNIGVFEGDDFELCGHSEFKARLQRTGTEGGELMLTSRDRTIPDIPFRGFEARVALETKTDLWPGCSIMAGYVDISGIIRIGLSVREAGSSR